MNLLSIPEKKNIRRQYRKKIFTIFGFLFAVLLVASTIPLVISHYAVFSNVEFIKDSVGRLTDSQALKDSITAANIVKSINRKIKLLSEPLGNTAKKDLVSTFNSIFGMAGEINKTGANLIKIASIVYASEAKGSAVAEGQSTPSGIIHKITLGGSAKSRNAFLSFLRFLEADKTFSNVDSPITNLVNSENPNFNLTLTLK